MKALAKLKDWYQQESVLVGVVLTAGSGLVEAFTTSLTPGQVSAITAFVGAVMGLLARSQVTPVAKGQ